MMLNFSCVHCNYYLQERFYKNHKVEYTLKQLT